MWLSTETAQKLKMNLRCSTQVRILVFCMAMMNSIPGLHAVYSPWIGSMQVSICRIQSVPLIFEYYLPDIR